MLKRILAATLLLVMRGGWAAGDNQFYTYAEVFESVPVYGKSSIECITCDDVLIGYKLGIRLVQRTRTSELPIIFDVVSKQPLKAGTWVKVGVRMNLITPIKAEP